MGYTLSAFAGRADALDGWNVPISHLTQGLALAPLTEELWNELQRRLELSGDPIDPWGLHASRGLRLAFLDGDFFGGTGGWSCRTFEDGRLLDSEVDVNAALTFLGVQVNGEDAFDTVGLGRFRHTDSWAAEAITDRLVDLEDPVPGWLAALTLERPGGELQSKVRCRAARALAHLILESPQLQLLERAAAEDPDAEVRLEATLALGSQGALAALERLLEQSDRWPALRALSRLGDQVRPLIPRLEPLLADPDWKIRIEVVQMIGELDGLPEPLVERLSGLLEDEEQLVRTRVVHALGGLRQLSPRALERLRAAASDPWPEVQWAARAALESRLSDGTES